MPTRILQDLTMGLQESFVTLKSRYERLFPERKIILTSGYRTPKEQFALFLQGRNKEGKITDISNVVTNCDGIKFLSKHNYYPAKAFDFAIVEKNKAIWTKKYFLPAGRIIGELDLIWGGNWRIKDYCHVETRD